MGPACAGRASWGFGGRGAGPTGGGPGWRACRCGATDGRALWGAVSDPRAMLFGRDPLAAPRRLPLSPLRALLGGGRFP